MIKEPLLNVLFATDFWSTRQLLTECRALPPEDYVSYAVALAQTVDHGIHHRTQALDRLRLLGVERERPWHSFEWDEAARFK